MTVHMNSPRGPSFHLFLGLGCIIAAFSWMVFVDPTTFTDAIVGSALTLVGLSNVGLYSGPVFVRLNRRTIYGNFIGSAWAWPFAIIAADRPADALKELERHEATHFYQACELFVVITPIVYGALFLRGRWIFGTWRDAYKFHPMEIDAFMVGRGHPRRAYGWMRYI